MAADDNASDPVTPTTLLTGAAYTGTISVIRLRTTLLSLASETPTITYDVIGSSDSGGGSSAGGSSNDVSVIAAGAQVTWTGIVAGDTCSFDEKLTSACWRGVYTGFGAMVEVSPHKSLLMCGGSSKSGN